MPSGPSYAALALQGMLVLALIAAAIHGVSMLLYYRSRRRQEEEDAARAVGATG